MTKYEERYETILLANADYEDRKLSGERVTYKMIERHWKLKAGSLYNFRANRNRRKYSGVTVIRKYARS